MQSPRRLILFLGVIGACFALGLLSAVLGLPPSEGENGPPTAPLPTWTVDPASSPQTTILILGVDSFAAPEPKLRAVWLASFRPPGRELFLLGLPPDHRPGTDVPSLAEQFRWTLQAGPGVEFLQAIHASAPQEVQVVAALDEVGFAAVIDIVGGIDLNGVPLRGDQAIAVLSLIEGDSSATITTQSRLLQALMPPAAALGTSPDVTPLVALIPQHAFLSEPFSVFAARLAPLLPLEPAFVHVDLLAGGTP